MKRLLTILTLAAICGVAQAQEAPKEAATCIACHGDKGGKPIAPEYPILAGQYSNYLEHALTEYKEGKRKNPVMTPQASQLSKEAIKALAQYFSLQESPLFTPSVHSAN